MIRIRARRKSKFAMERFNRILKELARRIKEKHPNSYFIEEVINRELDKVDFKSIARSMIRRK